MTLFLHKKITLKKKENLNQSVKFSVFGRLMGWTDGETEIDCKNIQQAIQENWEKDGINSMIIFMKGVVGPCIIEIQTENEIYFFASCASGGFYWIQEQTTSEDEVNYIVSNNEGKFIRKALQMGESISEGALMNAIVSHQALIRPLFNGLVSKTMRCPPGFFVKFSISESNLESYLINTKNKSREQQDIIIKKKIKSIASIYKKYSKIFEMDIKLAFSGGVDSTALLLVYKNALNDTSKGFYSKRGKLKEFKIAKNIASRLGCNIDFIDPYKNFSHLDVRRRASVGLSMLNGIPYMKQGFQFSPYKLDENKKSIIITGQNSDTLFHIDTKAPSSFTTGLIRLIKMAQGLTARLRTTMSYYNLQNFLNKNNSKKILPPSVKDTYLTLNEHGGRDKVLSKNINNILNNYKNLNYFLPLEKWLQKEFYPTLINSELNGSEKLNHATRFARWLRTIGNFHQGFFNISFYEKILICVPFSEGPMASELLSYKLKILDAFTPKMFLHNFINKQLGKSYNKIRQEVLGGSVIKFPWELVYYSSKIFTKFIKKFFRKKDNNDILNSRTISKKDIENLRKILTDKDENINRILLNYIHDNECKKYLNYLYDCLDLNVEVNSIKAISGMHLCRLVNLQIMLYTRDETIV